MLEDSEDAGFKCKLEERGRDINEFTEFILAGVDDDTNELLITMVANEEMMSMVIIKLIELYIERWEKFFQEEYGYPQEVEIETVVEDFVKAAKRIDFDRPKDMQ